jgi:transcriptional regulator with XRE-family HTH domain
MEIQKISKADIARKMGTSRVAIDNILNPNFNNSIGTLERFANLLGSELHISLS